MSGLFVSFDLSASGLAGMRRKMDNVAANIANAETSRTPEGGPYRRKVTTFRTDPRKGAFASKLKKAHSDLRRTHKRHIAPTHASPLRKAEIPIVSVQTTEGQTVRFEYMPGHPDADADGFVAMPDIDILSEMVEMMVAARAYEANATALEAAKMMARKALEI